MYTTEELHTAGIIMATTPSVGHVGSGRPARSEFEDSDITDTEGLCDIFEESTDTKMACFTHTTLMITSNREKVRLEALIREQDLTVNEAIRQVQEWHLGGMQAIIDTTHCREDECSTHKHRSTSQEDDVKRSREESPEAGTVPQERGRSLHHKSKSDLQYPTSPSRRCPSSQSFIPLMACLHSRSGTPSRQRSHSRSTTLKGAQCRDSTPHTSRKRPVAWPPRPTEVTLMQSPVQKTLNLKSLVQRASATKNYQDPPYKALETDPRDFIWYLMGNLDRKAYDAEIQCLATLPAQSTVIANRVVATTVTTLVVANRGIHFLMPFIPTELMSSPANPMDSELPGLLSAAPITKWMSQSSVRGSGCTLCISCNTGMMHWHRVHLWRSSSSRRAN